MWLTEIDADGEPARSDFFWRYGFLQKCGFFRYLDPSRVQGHCDHKLDEVDQRIEELELFLERMRGRESDPYRELIVDYGIRFERMRRLWLQDLRKRALELGSESEEASGQQEGRQYV